MPNIIFSRTKIQKALFLASLDAAYNSEAKMYWAQALDPAGWGATVRILSFIGVTSKTMGPTIFEIKKFPKWLYLTSLDAARRLDAESLIREAWIILDQEAGYLLHSSVRAELTVLPCWLTLRVFKSSRTESWKYYLEQEASRYIINFAKFVVSGF